MIQSADYQRLCDDIQEAGDLVTIGTIMTDIFALTGYPDQEFSPDKVMAYLLSCQNFDYDSLSMIVDLFERCQSRLVELQQLSAN